MPFQVLRVKKVVPWRHIGCAIHERLAIGDAAEQRAVLKQQQQGITIEPKPGHLLDSSQALQNFALA